MFPSKPSFLNLMTLGLYVFVRSSFKINSMFSSKFSSNTLILTLSIPAHPLFFFTLRKASVRTSLCSIFPYTLNNLNFPYTIRHFATLIDGSPLNTETSQDHLCLPLNSCFLLSHPVLTDIDIVIGIYS